MAALGAMIAFFLFLAVVYLILRPFLVPEAIVDDDLATIQLDIQKDRIIEAIREIDMDYQTGKLSDDDYNLLRSRYTAAAGEIIRRIDSDAAADAQAEPEEQALPPVQDAETDDGFDDELDDELERQIAERKSAMKEAR
jgi:hypothetical protein